MPNFSRVYHLALERLTQKGLEPFTTRELWDLGAIIALELQDADDPIALRLLDELEEFQVSKWVAVACWTNPWGLGSNHPELVNRMARYLLGETKDLEEKGFPPEYKTLRDRDG